MEICTFLRMGGTIERISVLPADDDGSSNMAGESVEKPSSGWLHSFLPEVKADAPAPSGKEEATLATVIQRFQRFDVSEADCFLKSDKEHLLGVIQQGFGSFEAFNDLVRATFTQAVDKEQAMKENGPLQTV